ncbi:putative cysteinyl-tRNA synthetase [Streptomyces phage Dagobah]|nr:putative cysteinyl-tRNA synthetase [Streptomyces phage Dagobah]
MRTDPDLTPLPAWKQRWAKFRADWRRSKDRRQKVRMTLQRTATLGVTLAFHLGGATLISFGVYQMYSPAGYICGGLMCWLLSWASERDTGRRE